MAPWPLDEEDNENLALIGVGLVSRQSAPSVMDATAPPNDVVMMEQAQPEVINGSPASVVASAPVAAAPTMMMPPSMTPAPMSTLGLSPHAASPSTMGLSPSA